MPKSPGVCSWRSRLASVARFWRESPLARVPATTRGRSAAAGPSGWTRSDSRQLPPAHLGVVQWYRAGFQDVIQRVVTVKHILSTSFTHKRLQWFETVPRAASVVDRHDRVPQRRVELVHEMKYHGRVHVRPPWQSRITGYPLLALHGRQQHRRFKVRLARHRRDQVFFQDRGHHKEVPPFECSAD